MTLDDLIRAALADPDGVRLGSVAREDAVAEVGTGEFDVWDVRRLDGSATRTFAATDRALTDVWGLPEGKGHNWNALSDDLRNMDWKGGACRVFVIDRAAELLADEPAWQLGAFLRIMHRVVEELAEPIALGEWWDRDGLTFRCVLIEDPGRIDHLRTRLRDALGADDGLAVVHDG